MAASTREPRKSRVVFWVCSRGRYTRNPSLDIYLLAVYCSSSSKFNSLEWLDPSVAEERDLVVPAGDGPRPARRRALLRLLVDEQVLTHAETLCGNKSNKKWKKTMS